MNMSSYRAFSAHSTSGLPFSSLSFDTTAAPSLLSALSSLISSESTAIMPYTSYAMYTGSGNVTATSPTPTSASPSVTFVTSSAAPTSTASGARRLSDSRSGVVAGLGLVLGVVAALVC